MTYYPDDVVFNGVVPDKVLIEMMQSNLRSNQKEMARLSRALHNMASELGRCSLEWASMEVSDIVKTFCEGANE